MKINRIRHHQSQVCESQQKYWELFPFEVSFRRVHAKTLTESSRAAPLEETARLRSVNVCFAEKRPFDAKLVSELYRPASAFATWLRYLSEVEWRLTKEGQSWNSLMRLRLVS